MKKIVKYRTRVRKNRYGYSGYVYLDYDDGTSEKYASAYCDGDDGSRVRRVLDNYIWCVVADMRRQDLA